MHTTSLIGIENWCHRCNTKGNKDDGGDGDDDNNNNNNNNNVSTQKGEYSSKKIYSSEHIKML
jgi:hypothetical protein